MEPIRRYLGQNDALSSPFDAPSQHEPSTGQEGDLDEAAEKFRQALSQGGDGSETETSREDSGLPSPAAWHAEEPSAAGPAELPGDSILRAFGFAPAFAAAPEGDSKSESLERLNTEILDRLLVTDRAYSEKQEVRMQIKDSILPGTEVRLSREGGEVCVRFVTTSPDSAALLGEHRADLLRQLEEKFPGERVSVEIEEEPQEQNEGRSRNRHDAQADEAGEPERN